MKTNPSLAHIIYNFRKTYLDKRSKSKNIICWEENHRLRSGPAKALVFILPTKGCSWALSRNGGCSICGYIYDNPKTPDYENIVKEFKKKLKSSIKENKNYSIKIFTSGSVLDQKELPLEYLQILLSEIAKYNNQIKEIVLETRPEYVKSEILDIISKYVNLKKVEIAIGLESSNDQILKNSINKGFQWIDFKNATKKVLSRGGNIKAYLLFKPPFISEYDSIKDIFQSTDKIERLGIDTISVNAVNIQRGTYLSYLFEKHQYRPPYLWSLVYICKTIKEKYPNLRIICDPVAGGKNRGPHNCGDCDNRVLDKLKKFTLSQNEQILDSIDSCKCQLEWKGDLLSEKIALDPS